MPAPFSLAHLARWHTARRWAVMACWLVCSVTAVAAQAGRWERVPTSLMNLAAVDAAQGQYADAAPLYQRALRLYELRLGPDHPQVAEVLEAQEALERTRHPVRSLLPWSPASRLAARARRIREQAERALLQTVPWGPLDRRQVVGDGTPGE